ncbi:DNA methyltransferase [Alkalibacterium putridalgicola]|uniref:DNA methyltransferase n=1 Tax=Alkalibacterium putridalgicola TaxID=426703 RepID=UPI0034CE628B
MNSTIETTLLNNIKSVLSDFPEYWDEETLLKNKVIEDLRHYDEKVITALLSNDKIKEAYALSVADMTIFKVEEFIEMLRYKNYWENSYTKYRNEIGLTSDGKYLNYNTDVVLDFPFKDCVLEGGMSNEDEGKKEVYYHNVIAKEEIDTLLSPKVLTNIKKYDEDGEHEITEFNDEDNLIIKGNNLLALHTLKERYAGKVKLIYIDPPYNTGNDSFRYNDRFNHSTWLAFINTRLEIARELLQKDGTIAISIDNNELGYLLVMLDELFGRNNRKNIITIKRGSVTGAKVINPGVVNIAEYVVIYSKDEDYWSPNRVFMENKNGWDKRYNQFIKNYDGGIEKWEFTTVLEEFSREMGISKSRLKKELEEDYEELLSNFVYKNSDRIAQLATLDENSISKKAIELKKESLEHPQKIFYMEREGRKPYYIVNGKLILFIKDRMVNIDGENTFAQPATDIWDDVLPNDIHNEGGVVLRKGKKPEKLISRIIDLCTTENDIVLDFFVGSGTTAAVSIKKKRQFIAIEQLSYIKELTTKRLINTINGESSGITNQVNWRGGGSFIYAELDSLNQHYIDKLTKITSEEVLESILEEMKSSAYLNFKVELNKVTVEDKHFSTLSIDEKKKVLIDVLDMNQLYLNYSEIDDTQYDISDEVKQFNHSFYGQGGE